MDQTGDRSAILLFYHPAGAASWTEAMRLAGEYLKEFRKENRGGRMALGLPMMVPKRCIRYEPEGLIASPPRCGSG